MIVTVPATVEPNLWVPVLVIVLSMIMGSIAVMPLIIVSFVLIPVIGGLLFLRHGFYWKN